MAKKKSVDNGESAVIAEAHASNNANMDRIVQSIVASFNPKDVTRIDRVTMIPNPRDVYEARADGQVVLIAKAGWAISAEEKAEVDRVLNDPVQRENNEKIWAAQEELGIKSRKATVGYKEVKVLNQANDDDD